jgi:lambda family phage portal protein
MNIYKDMYSSEYSDEYKKLLKHRETVLQKYSDNEPSASLGYPGNYGYNGGYWGASRGDGSKWVSGMSSTGASPVLDHYLLRQNARSAYHESIQGRIVVDRTADLVVDTGLKLEATPSYEVLQITQEDAALWSDDVEQRYHMWAKEKHVTLDRTMNFYQIQRLVNVSQTRDGEYFARFYYSDDKNLVSPLQIQLIDPNQISGYGFTNTYGYQCSVDGIERDAGGKEIAYQVVVKKSNGHYDKIRVPAESPKSGLPMMIHGFQAEYSGQGRGYSRISHALQDLEKLTDFQLAHIQKAINQASLTMYVKPSQENDSSDPFGSVPSNQFGAVPVIPESAQSVDPAATLDLSEYMQYCDIPEATLSRPGVGVFSLRSGEDLKAFQDTTPAEQYDRFVDAFFGHLAASVGQSVETVLMKFGENYSASRAALILSWRVSNIWQNELATDFLNPIYETWLSLEIAKGRIRAPGWSDPIMRSAWTSNKWIGAPMPDIDPLRHSKATKEYISIGATDLDRAARNVNGSVGSSNRAKLSRQLPELPSMPWEKGAGNEKAGEKTTENE